jgi:hypothetical protein
VMDQPAPSEKSWRAFDVRTIACVRSATSWQGGSLVRAGEPGEPERVYRFMSAHQAMYPIRTLACPGGFGVRLCAWRSLPASPQATANADLTRRIWALSADLKTRVVLDALEMALAARKPDNAIHPSDRGSQYTSIAFGNRRKEAGGRLVVALSVYFAPSASSSTRRRSDTRRLRLVQASGRLRPLWPQLSPRREPGLPRTRNTRANY